jgi:L-amino acid N-acyltransferase YncA
MNLQHFSIRLISETDAPAVLEIYKPYILHTSISFEYEPPSEAEFLQRIKTVTADYPWLVCLDHEKIIGYAYASRHRTRTAYDWSAESTVYILPGYQRKGFARILYETVFEILRLQGYFNVFAGITMPNDSSVGFHRALGFKEIGTYKNIGYKLGNWHDTYWMQLSLTEYIHNPPFPKKMKEITGTALFEAILKKANEKLFK